MRYLILTILISTTYSFSWAQESSIKIEEDTLITKLVLLKTKVNKAVYASQFYSIQIYNGGYKKSLAIRRHLRNKFGQKTNISFETPNYKVQMGPFRNYRETVNLLKLVKKIYPAAFLIEPKKNL